MRLFAAILLLLHVNFSMFIAQIDEKDIYDANLQQVQDINSLSEYIQQLLPHHNGHHKKHKDNDDDNARYFHCLKPHFFLAQPSAVVKRESPLPLYNTLPLRDETRLASGFSDTPYHPPKA